MSRVYVQQCHQPHETRSSVIMYSPTVSRSESVMFPTNCGIARVPFYWGAITLVHLSFGAKFCVRIILYSIYIRKTRVIEFKIVNSNLGKKVRLHDTQLYRVTVKYVHYSVVHLLEDYWEILGNYVF